MGPSAYCLQKFPPVTYFAFNVLCWGILEMCMAACTSFGGLFVCRFLLGGFEALLIPAVTLVIAMWYKPNEQPARNAIILNVVAPILNGLLAWAVGYHKGDYPAWKIIFLTLGAFTILWSLVVFYFLPNNPLEAKWLSDREKYMLIQRKATDNTGLESKTFKPHQITEALLDPKTWLIWFAIIALQVPNGGLTTFNTLIISGLGFDAKKTSLLAMPPGAMSTLSGIGLSYLAARTRKWRSVLVAVSILLPLMGAVICYTLPRTNLAGQLVGLYILYTYWAPYITLVSIYQANIAGHTKKVFLFAWFYVSWAAGNIIGPQTFLAYQAPAYTGGTVAMIVCYVVAIFFKMANFTMTLADAPKSIFPTGRVLTLRGGAGSEAGKPATSGNDADVDTGPDSSESEVDVPDTRGRQASDRINRSAPEVSPDSIVTIDRTAEFAVNLPLEESNGYSS
ncbi:hypothetical protein G7Y89_g3470 [Cudoniella acicularis]|uniref:Major facilitator superfamily (MFS) profile domain-containing protein n=1 Tax=Cudoniella acicularis TaxID=354080 RepID=A0A8H4W7L8_9HELO|nr:hypothetical protein G7Y89_g3470 [Cudoniella acicularis]